MAALLSILGVPQEPRYSRQGLEPERWTCSASIKNQSRIGPSGPNGRRTKRSVAVPKRIKTTWIACCAPFLLLRKHAALVKHRFKFIGEQEASVMSPRSASSH